MAGRFFERRGDAAALVALHDDLGVLALADHERVAGAGRELVAAQVREHAVAVAAIEHEDRQRVRARRDRAVEHVDVLLVVELAGVVRARQQLRAVEGVDHLDEAEVPAHVVLVGDRAARADAARDHGLFQHAHARFHAPGLLLELLDLLFELAQLHGVGLFGRRFRGGRRGIARSRGAGRGRAGRGRAGGGRTGRRRPRSWSPCRRSVGGGLGREHEEAAEGCERGGAEGKCTHGLSLRGSSSTGGRGVIAPCSVRHGP